MKYVVRAFGSKIVSTLMILLLIIAIIIAMILNNQLQGVNVYLVIA